jgi:uncharacterized damage-inducible protein DinB
MTTHVRRLFEHLVWADARVLAALRERSGDDPRALDLYAHVLGAEHVWAARLRGEAATVPVWPALTLEGCAELSTRTHAEYAAVLDALEPGALARLVAYTNSAGQRFDSTVEDILLHVALHGSYHRGQVALLMRAGGGEPASTDYIAFVRGAPAATRGAALSAGADPW